MTDTSVEILNDLIVDQLKKRVVIIETETRRAHLRLKLTEAEIERQIDFSVASAQKIDSKRYRANLELQTALSLKKELKFKMSKIYFHDTQKFFDKYIKECVNEFDFKSKIYQFDKTKILFASKYLSHAVFND